MNIELKELITEQRNERTMNFSEMSILDAVTVMNSEDEKVVRAVRSVLPFIADAIGLCVNSLKRGGRIIYMGAGTAGRMGLLDAVECPPTFGIEGKVIGLLAGGESAFIKAKEGAEDDIELAKKDLLAVSVSEKDTVIGISASGRTPYVLGGLKYAGSIGTATVAVSCNPNASISSAANIAIEAVAGPECLTGSTRLKAGSVQKMILNMISTVSMAKIGRIKENLMIYVRPTNEKLIARAENIKELEKKL